MAEIAATLGVTESRVSQLRAEALVLLRDALNRELEPDLVPERPRPGGAADRRREAYFAAVAARHASGLRRSARTRPPSTPRPDGIGAGIPKFLRRSPQAGPLLVDRLGVGAHGRAPPRLTSRKEPS